MATTYYMSPISLLVQLFSNIGIPLQGGMVYTYVAGSVNTPLTTYTDSTGTTANANPIALSSTGRLVAASGAPVACWVPAGNPIKMIILDSTSAFVLSLDNIPALNDPTALLALLATVSTASSLGGADIVANAMRSYDVFSTIRAAAVPSLASGQTLIVDAEGALSYNDGNGGFFYWDAGNTGTDDGIIYLKPNTLSAAQPGRYVRQAQTGYGGSVQSSLIIGGPSGPINIKYSVIQNVVTMRIPAFSGTSTSTSFEIILPAVAGLIPAVQQQVCIAAMQDNGAPLYNQAANVTPVPGVSATINLNFYKNGSLTGWTASGTKGVGDGSGGLYSQVIQYLLN